MSSLAATQSDGFYHPPDWDPTKSRRDKFQGSRGSNQWEKYGVLRFELMYDCWCLGCKRSIGRGTRYNAKKTAVGKYHTTTIWEFTMKCASCPQGFVIRTDPKNLDYEFVSGIRPIAGKANVVSDRDAAAGRLEQMDRSKKLETDPMFKLEHEEDDKRKARAARHWLERQADRSDARYHDDYGANRRLRASHRARRKEVARLRDDGTRAGLPFALLPAATADRVAARKALPTGGGRSSSNTHATFSHAAKRARLAIQTSSIFGGGVSGRGGKAGGGSLVLATATGGKKNQNKSQRLAGSSSGGARHMDQDRLLRSFDLAHDRGIVRRRLTTQQQRPLQKNDKATEQPSSSRATAKGAHSTPHAGVVVPAAEAPVPAPRTTAAAAAAAAAASRRRKRKRECASGAPLPSAEAVFATTRGRVPDFLKHSQALKESRP